MTGAVDPRQSLRLALQLPLRNQAELTQLLHDLYDPESTRISQVSQRGGSSPSALPDKKDYNSVVSWAKTKGLT